MNEILHADVGLLAKIPASLRRSSLLGDPLGLTAARTTERKIGLALYKSVLIYTFDWRVVAITLSHRRVHVRSDNFVYLAIVYLSISFSFSLPPRFSSDLTRPAVLPNYRFSVSRRGIIVSYNHSDVPTSNRGRVPLPPRERGCDDGEPLLALASLAPDYCLLSHPRALLYLFPPLLLLHFRFRRRASRERSSAGALYLDFAPVFFAAVVRCAAPRRRG